jgi:hypothetical protein
MQKEEEEMEKNTKLNAGALKNTNCMDVDLEFGANTRIVEFMAMVVSTHRKHIKKHAKIAMTEKKQKKRTAGERALLQCKKKNTRMVMC